LIFAINKPITYKKNETSQKYKSNFRTDQFNL
jgi:hypothetical protein